MVSPFLTAFCVCVFAYHIIGNFREIEVSRFFAAFFFKAKILGCGKRTPLLFVTRKTHNFSESQQISFREISPHKITN